jgi:hypothetical protein
MHDDTKIARLLGQLNHAVQAQITELNGTVKAEEETMAARVQGRKQLAMQLQLSQKLLTIYEDVKYYPAWTQNDPTGVCPSVNDLEVNEESLDLVTVRFSLNNRRYSLVFDGHWYSPRDPRDEGYYFATLALFPNLSFLGSRQR